ncbi:MAG: hypothetical protein A2275_09940 [Bacteroidetes bacterium RIFOXYA12_FULL_35_11]|nr:MAG: hypothetical protein A2X01_03635 [Bacteroidetes bacterium GWF2_35_48]OFY82318.1 MAG: hypothetical protein A2275_09940 [Bacteroidetes bacterium RIFOXYA12_FULL_35_11]OFY97490.1 MAG: hypothetical protein A2309_06925 [Bacteroidetes bacterium RIFOXYB2_FULL_35_7]HBX51035.1 hypothetical protein [Bacteroidales bacterium]
MSKQLKSVFFNLIYLLPIGIIPLVFSFSTIDPVLHPRFTVLAAFVLLFSFMTLYAHRKKNLFFVQEKFFTIYLLYFIISSLSLFYYSINFADGLFEWMKIFLAGGFLFLLVQNMKNDDALIEKISKIIVIVSGIALFTGLFQLYDILVHEGLTHQSAYKMSSLYANKNIFAEIMFVSLPFTIYCGFTYRGLWKISGFLFSFFSVVLIIISLTRAVWVAAILSFVMSLPLLYFFYFRKFKTIKTGVKKIIILSAIFIAACSIVLFVFAKFGSLETIVKQSKSITGFTYGSTKDRIELWKKTFEFFYENPVVGTGLGSWKINILKYGNQELKSENNSTFYQRPHNDFLWILTEQGIFGLSAYLLLLFFFYKYLFSIFKKSEDQKTNLFFILIFFGFTGYLIFSLLSFPKERIEHIVFITAMFAPVLIYRWKLYPPRNLKKTGTLIIVILLIIVSGIALYIGIKRTRAEINTMYAYNARANSNWAEVVSKTDIALDYFYQIDPVSTPLYWYRGLANYNMNKMQEAFSDFKKAYKINPYHIHVINNLGTCYALQQNTKEATRLFKESLKIAPNFSDASLNLCAVYFNDKKFTDAYTVFEKINPDTMNQKYIQFLKIIAGAQLEEKIEKEKNNHLKEWYSKLISNEKLFTEIYLKSIKNRISFSKQLLLDYIWCLENNKKNSILATEIKQQFFL